MTCDPTQGCLRCGLVQLWV